MHMYHSLQSSFKYLYIQFVIICVTEEICFCMHMNMHIHNTQLFLLSRYLITLLDKPVVKNISELFMWKIYANSFPHIFSITPKTKT